MFVNVDQLYIINNTKLSFEVVNEHQLYKFIEPLYQDKLNKLIIIQDIYWKFEKQTIKSYYCYYEMKTGDSEFELIA